MAEPVRIPMTMLPIDLQAQLRKGEGVDRIVGVNLGGGGGLLGALAVIGATALAANGLLSALLYHSAPFSTPARWLSLVIGGALLGAIHGQRQRLDARRDGVRSILVGPTSLVLLDRDSLLVFPAEHVTVEGDHIAYQGSVIERSLLVPEQREAIARATAAAADEGERSRDRWRAIAAATHRPPVSRWTPVIHGMLLGVALAITVEIVLVGRSDRHDGEEWAARRGRMREVVGADARDAAKQKALAGTDEELLAYYDTTDGWYDNDIRAEAERRVRARIDKATDLDSMEAALAVVRRQKLWGLEGEYEPRHGQLLAAAIPSMSVDDAIARVIAAHKANKDYAFSEAVAALDEQIAAEIAHIDSIDALRAAWRHIEVVAELGKLPRSMTAIADRNVVMPWVAAARNRDDIELLRKVVDNWSGLDAELYTEEARAALLDRQRELCRGYDRGDGWDRIVGATAAVLCEQGAVYYRVDDRAPDVTTVGSLDAIIDAVNERVGVAESQWHETEADEDLTITISEQHAHDGACTAKYKAGRHRASHKYACEPYYD